MHNVHLIATIILVVLIALPVAAICITKNVVVSIVAGISGAIQGAIWLWTRNPVTTIAILVALLFAEWAFVPTGRVPHFRVQSIRIRLRLRLHPGHGFATAPTIANHWGRFASYWASKRTRPRLGRMQRALHPSSHGIFLGRAHYRLGLRLPIQEHMIVFGPPRAYKSGFFARAIANYEGSVVSTSTKPDMLMLTGGVRQHRGSPVCFCGPLQRLLAAVTFAAFASTLALSVLVLIPGRQIVTAALAVVVSGTAFFLAAGIRRHRGSPVYVFNPQRLGPFGSNMRWNLVRGCAEPAVAIRRAQALCEATSTEGTEEATFWSEQAAMQMRALLCAADLMGQDFRIVNHWILSGQTRQAEDKLKEAGYVTWGAVLEQMRSGKAERTTATIRLVLSSAVAFMSDPMLAECVTPGPGDEFDIERFLMEAGSLYLIGEQRGKNSPIAPLFSGLVTEIQFTAQQLAGSMPGQRLDPPLLLALDEVTQIVPIPLPSIVADSGGRGIQLLIAAHGIAQLRSRWDVNGAQTILDCCNKMFNPGIQDDDTLELAERLAGREWFKVPGAEKREQLPIIPFEGVRQLPPKRSLIIRTWNAPVVARLAMGWRDWRYVLAGPLGYRLPTVIPIPPTGQSPAEILMAGLPRMEPVVPVSAGGEDFPEGQDEDELEPTPAGASAHLAGVPQQPRYAPASLTVPQARNGSSNGSSNGHQATPGDGAVTGNGHGPAGQGNGHSSPWPHGAAPPHFHGPNGSGSGHSTDSTPGPDAVGPDAGTDPWEQ